MLGVFRRAWAIGVLCSADVFAKQALINVAEHAGKPIIPIFYRPTNIERLLPTAAPRIPDRPISRLSGHDQDSEWLIVVNYLLQLPPPPGASAAQIRMLVDEIGAAFISRLDLTQVVESKLGEQLDAIAAGSTYKAIIASLVAWADAEGRLHDLVSALAAERPHNTTLRDLAAVIQ